MTPHEKQIIDIICPAIQSENLIRFWYKNATSGLQDWRIAQPYLIGSFPKKHIQLSAWLVPTPEQLLAGQLGGWRAYILKNISEVEVLDKKIERQTPDYDPKGGGMKDIFCAAKKEPTAFMKIA